MSEFAFDPTAYSPAVAELLREERLPALGPGSPNRAARPALEKLSAETLAGVRPTDATAARACLSGLWLWHDFLDESHAISQDVANADGSMWHAIMHRREPDAWNSKYWWRQVGAHATLPRVATAARELGHPYSSPFDFVDFCEKVRDTASDDEVLARRVQAIEWRILFDHCWRKAFG